VGCGHDDAGAAAAKTAYPRDAELRLNHLQAKGTHNSYHIETAGNTEPSWMYTHAPLDVQLDQQGVRMVELDTHWNKDTSTFDVYHLTLVDQGTTCKTLPLCLTVLKGWSDAHPLHHPIFVMFEPKDDVPLSALADPEGYVTEFETEILSVWPRERIVKPDDVRAGAATLREAVTTQGWPTLAASRGKILFFVNNTDKFRTAYTRGGVGTDGRLMFAQPDTQADPYAAVLVLNDAVADRAAIESGVRAGFVVRTFADGAGDIVAGVPEQALAGGAHIISTDYPVVGDAGYSFVVPGGMPSRCNPLIAPAGCASSDIEDPSRLVR
jgi:hypothetical protein